MKFTGEVDAWLPWVIKIRFVIITFVFAIEYSIQQVAPAANRPDVVQNLGMAVILWYILNLFYLIYNQISRDYSLQAYLQILSDVGIITWIVHVTGDLESNYLSLYLVAIILASIVMPRARVFLVAAVSFVFMGLSLELAYLPSLYPQLARRYPAIRFFETSSELPADLGALQVKIFASLFAFFAVAYLASYLAESLRKAGAELKDRRGQVANLQAINENIIHSMRDGLVTTDLEGAIQDVNPAGASLLGRRRDELGGKFVAEVFPTLPPPDHRAVAPVNPNPRQEIIYAHPRGEHRVLAIAASPLVLPGTGVIGFVYSFQDLTEEKRLEAEYRAKDRMATLGRLSAGIAHEIRNPLASIAGSVRLLQGIARLDDDQAKLIDIVSRESERLNKLVSDFLVYSRHQRFDFRDVDLVNLLEETLLLVEHHPAFGRGCRIEKKLPRGPVLAYADPDKLRQVFWNICDNSLKAMETGGTLTAEIEDGNAQRTRVVLSDTGVGFTEGQLEKLFEPFQAGFSDGTGLGLAIVYQIIEGHHGQIQVKSQPGKGSQFLIELPRAPVVAA